MNLRMHCHAFVFFDSPNVIIFKIYASGLCFSNFRFFTILDLIRTHSLSIIYNMISKVLKFLIFIELEFESCTPSSVLN